MDTSRAFSGFAVDDVSRASDFYGGTDGPRSRPTGWLSGTSPGVRPADCASTTCGTPTRPG